MIKFSVLGRRGSALAAATGGDPKIGKEAILQLMEAVSALDTALIGALLCCEDCLLLCFCLLGGGEHTHPREGAGQALHHASRGHLLHLRQRDGGYRTGGTRSTHENIIYIIMSSNFYC